MDYQQEHCKVCQKHDWDHFGTLLSGIWSQEPNDLVREELVLPIGECQYCGHVQMMRRYDAHIFECLYFSNIRPPAMFFLPKEGEVSPYFQMVDFFREHVSTDSNVVDFGCGAGNIFKEMKQQHLTGGVLTGVDFLPMIEDEFINQLAWNLNSKEEIPKTFWPQGVDLALNTHVLEHVENPVAFLSMIRNQLKPDGKVFIEVPDCSENTDLTHLAFTNVVHGQHIHYFTKDSLAQIAQVAGFTVIKTAQIMTRSIPRLLMLLENGPISQQIAKVPNSAKKAVWFQLEQTAALHNMLALKIEEKIKYEGVVGLWGVGGDTYQLFKAHKNLIPLLLNGQITLFDGDLQGHSFKDAEILSSRDIENSKLSIFITPLYELTKEKMLAISVDWASTILDPYC
ncbi:Methyltransferase type 12 [Shewanella denitrificans OS217]|uniref:Methyltransferase type 12 n=1 Tax=Shewanella denitrificans (strain OS217 / ATCC BAA-1090 / DSM 15013) TaxID=318161 RepID=Q12JJ5_SHEDO|nr:class I SAM-dependent methyltransferase [Shewanella denitrificans]ABE56381.1 Methyltransferase type 12 [Shewanella denitrificans OS217]